MRRVLPFSLTGAQKRVLKEIADDLESDRPMYRLLQGDVGSGKTIVALIAAIIMIRNGHQVALLAPTEILAEQHYQRIRQLLDDSARRGQSAPARCRRRAAHTAGRPARRLHPARRRHPRAARGARAFKSLGLAIVDEQHRFGVEQRQKLFAKGELPDILVMTATPIPRSLALAMYGDLELSGDRRASAGTPADQDRPCARQRTADRTRLRVHRRQRSRPARRSTSSIR